MRKWLTPDHVIHVDPPPGPRPAPPPAAPEPRNRILVSCTVDHQGGPCSWDADSFHMEYEPSNLAPSATGGPSPKHDSEPGAQTLITTGPSGRTTYENIITVPIPWQGPTEEEWVRRIGGKDVPWIR